MSICYFLVIFVLNTNGDAIHQVLNKNIDYLMICTCVNIIIVFSVVSKLFHLGYQFQKCYVYLINKRTSVIFLVIVVLCINIMSRDIVR